MINWLFASGLWWHIMAERVTAQNQSPHEWKGKERKRSGSLNPSFGTPPGAKSLPTRPLPLRISPSLNSTNQGKEPLSLTPLSDIEVPNKAP